MEIIGPKAHNSASNLDMNNHAKFGLWLVGVLFFVIFIWGSIAQISGAVIAMGRISLESNVKRIQHREGGIVREILVKEGEMVNLGDTLVRMDPTVASANVTLIEKQIWQLIARKERLEAERDKKGYTSIVVPETEPIELQGIISAERELMRTRAEFRLQRKQQLREQIAQSNHEISGIRGQTSALRSQSALINREVEGVSEVYRQGFSSYTRLSQIQREAQQIRGQISSLVSAESQARARIAQLETAILQVESEALSEIMAELKDVETRLAQLQEQNITTRDVATRLEIKSPVAGKVQQLSVHTNGGVVSPGETMMIIVPQFDSLIVEARIDPAKADEVRIGSKAFVRFTAFNSQTTPEAIGKVNRITSDVEVDERTGQSFYKALIELPPTNLPKSIRGKLVSGQPVEVQIETKSRSALSYFTKPLGDQISRTFKEE